MKKFVSLYVPRLSNENAYGFSQSIVKIAQNLDAGLSKLALTIVAKLEEASNTMGHVVLKRRGSYLTQQVVEANDICKAEYSRIKETIRFYLKDEDAAMRQAATDLYYFMKPYWKIPARVMDLQTTLIQEMLQKYHAHDTLPTQSATLKLDEHFIKLETLNTEFSMLYQTRASEMVANSSQSATRMRKLVNKLIVDFCTLIELEVNHTPTDTLIQLFGEIDVLRKKYGEL